MAAGKGCQVTCNSPASQHPPPHHHHPHHSHCPSEQSSHYSDAQTGLCRELTATTVVADAVVAMVSTVDGETCVSMHLSHQLPRAGR